MRTPEDTVDCHCIIVTRRYRDHDRPIRVRVTTKPMNKTEAVEPNYSHSSALNCRQDRLSEFSKSGIEEPQNTSSRLH